MLQIIERTTRWLSWLIVLFALIAWLRAQITDGDSVCVWSQIPVHLHNWRANHGTPGVQSSFCSVICNAQKNHMRTAFLSLSQCQSIVSFVRNLVPPLSGSQGVHEPLPFDPYEETSVYPRPLLVPAAHGHSSCGKYSQMMGKRSHWVLPKVWEGKMFVVNVCASIAPPFLPPQSEVYDDPASVQPPQPPHLQVPQLFLFSWPSTAHQDLDTATALAWRLRGVALLVLVHR